MKRGCARRQRHADPGVPVLCRADAAHTILIDSCIGNDKPRPAWPHWNMKSDDNYLRAFAAAGFSVGDIDYVMCTHLHVDHVGWKTRLDNGRWVRPSERALRVNKTEFDYWTETNAKTRLRRSSTACCVVERAGPKSCATILRWPITPASCDARPYAGHVASPSAAARKTGVFGDLMHSPIQAILRSCRQVRRRPGAGAKTAAASWSVIATPIRCAARAFPLAVDGENQRKGSGFVCETA